MNNDHNVIEHILKALKVLNTEGDSSEDGRVKSLTKTKLEEALLWARHLYKPVSEMQ